MKYPPDKPPVLTNRHEPRPACTANSAFSAGWISGLVDATAVHYLSLESWISGSIPLDAFRVRPMCLSPVPRPLGIWSYASVRRSLPLISNFPPALPTSALYSTLPFLRLCHELCRTPSALSRSDFELTPTSLFAMLSGAVTGI